MKTVEGEIIDGPYENKKEFDKALELYIKWYKYSPVVSMEWVDAKGFTQPEDYDECGFQTGKTCRD